MPNPDELLKRNRAWAKAAREADPERFKELAQGQSPRYLWLGCADSRVPATQVMGLEPGDVFVHRNVANRIAAGDTNAEAVLQYALEALKIPHIIVCGHYGCGGVAAALDEGTPEGPVGRWIAPLKELAERHADELAAIPDRDARWARLCELNVAAQLQALKDHPLVRAARERGQTLELHGWIYDPGTGELQVLQPC